MNLSHEPPPDISNDRSKMQEVLSVNAEKYSFLVPYLAQLSSGYRDGLMEAIVLSNEIGEKLHISEEHREIVHLATLLSDIGKFGNKDFQSGSNKAMRWLYSFDTSLESHEKQIPLREFLGPKNGGTSPRLSTWLEEKDITVSSEEIQNHFQGLRNEAVFEEYAKEYSIDYDTITLAEAWSLYHILSGEVIWKDLRAKHPTIIQDVHIDLARLHHLKEGVHARGSRDKFLREDPTGLHSRLLCIMILADKIQALQSRTRMSDAHIHNTLTLTDSVRQNLGTITEKYESIKMDTLPFYLKRVSSERRKFIQRIITHTGARVDNILTWLGKDRRQMERRNREAFITPGYLQRG